MSPPSVLSEKTLLLNKPEAHFKQRYVLAIHGGAGTMSKDRITPEQRVRYKVALSKALQAGYAVLKEGGEAMDAAVAAVSVMEGAPTSSNPARPQIEHVLCNDFRLSPLQLG